MWIAQPDSSADKVDANASAFFEASRRASRMEEQFIDRLHNYPADWNVPHALSENPIAESVTERYINRFRWRETLVATAVILTITAISIAVLPSILGETAGKNRLSQADHQSREIKDRAVSVESISVPADTATVSWVDNPEETQRLENELQAVVAEMPERAETLDEYGPPLAGNMERDLLPQEEQQAVVAGVMPIVPVAESVEPGRAETIEQLLSKGQQSLDDFRLLTPEEDNAYVYYRAVLLLDPANKDANEGIQEIVDRYIMLVRTAADQHENARARRYVTRGLSIQPENRELLMLQDSINRAIQSASADTGTVADIEGASLETASPGERPIQDSLIQGIRTFFENRKAEARSGVVHTPAGWEDLPPN